jgi:outer membrane cobalamin receptor
MTPWNLDVDFTWRYFGKTTNDNENDTLENELFAVNYIDISAIYSVNDNIQLRGTVLNLFGEDPPIFSGAGPNLGNGNTYPVSYVKLLGRSWAGGATPETV